MVLASCAREFRAQARADFRRYYGLDFDSAARERPLYAADLAAMLPPDSRTVQAMDPQGAPLDAATLLTLVEVDLRCIAAGLAGEGGRVDPVTASSARGRAAFDIDAMRAVGEALGIDAGFY